MTFIPHINNITSKATRTFKSNLCRPVRKFKGTLFTAWIINDYNYEHIVSLYTLLQNLGWPTLQYHCKRMRLSLLYKSVNLLSAFRIPDHFTSIYTATRIHLIISLTLEQMPTCKAFPPRLSRNGMIYPFTLLTLLHLIYFKNNWIIIISKFVCTVTTANPNACIWFFAIWLGHIVPWATSAGAVCPVRK